MKVWGDFLGPPRSTDKTTLIIKVRKGAKIRNRYNQVPHLTKPFIDLPANITIPLLPGLFGIQ